MDERDWVRARLADAPARLRDEVLRAWDAAEGGSGAERCARAALSILDDADRIADSRAGALSLLAADALLTLACEHAAEFDLDGLPAFARSIGPAGAFAAG